MILVSVIAGVTVFSWQGPAAIQNAMFIVEMLALVVGLAGLGFAPRRVSTVYLDRAGLYKRPSISGGVIALSLLLAGIIVIVVSAVASSL